MSDVPVIELQDELMSRKQVSEWLGVSQRRIAEAHSDHPPIPYIRVFRKVFYSRRQIGWWFSEIQKLPDSVAIDIRRAKGQLAGGSK